jgi:ABC-type polysaccharide/polyol phosphate transport system ATPase subunit
VSANPAISIKGLCKRYKLYSRPADVFWEFLKKTPRHKEYWALKDVSFDVGQGEVVGIIGRNGAGKSTILKIISGTLNPTSGTVEISGKVSAILELGSGFHPEYTGRENILMGGMCLGMTREEALAKTDEIIAFSELQSVIDQPFKTYSSGMQARLTFSTAISVEPDILIIDEALAAGDVLFQEKCYRRIREIATSGATVLFVTHSLPTIYDLCSRAVLLHKGELLVDDIPRKVGYAYERLLAQERGSAVRLHVASAEASGPLPPPSCAPGEGGTAVAGNAPCAERVSASSPLAEIVSIRMVNREGVETGTLHWGEEYEVEVACRARRDMENLGLSFRIQKLGGQVVYGLGSMYLGKLFAVSAGNVLAVRFSLKCLFGSGEYLIGGGVVQTRGESDFEVLHVVRDVFTFTVISNERFQGIVDMQSKVTSSRLETAPRIPEGA